MFLRSSLEFLNAGKIDFTLEQMLYLSRKEGIVKAQSYKGTLETYPSWINVEQNMMIYLTYITALHLAMNLEHLNRMCSNQTRSEQFIQAVEHLFILFTLFDSVRIIPFELQWH